MVGNQQVNRSGFTGGVTGGYNWQINAAVIGIEADFNYFGVEGIDQRHRCLSLLCTDHLHGEFVGILRLAGDVARPGRLPRDAGSAALRYRRPRVANVRSSYLFTDTFAAANKSAAISTTRYGWTAGAGAEYALLNGWSIKAEYLYADFGRASTTSTNLTTGGARAYPTSVFTQTVNLRSNIGRVGINYKFGGPVVAKY